MRLSPEYFCSVVGKVLTCLDASSFDVLSVLVHVPRFLASKFHVLFSKICTPSELLFRQSIRASTFISTLLYQGDADLSFFVREYVSEQRKLRHRGAAMIHGSKQNTEVEKPQGLCRIPKSRKLSQNSAAGRKHEN